METIHTNLKIGQRLRKLRTDKGYKQEYLAEVLAISQKTYSNMENDKSSISIDALMKIADEYNIDLLELLSGKKIILQHTIDNGPNPGMAINNHSEELLNQLKARVGDLMQVISEKNKQVDIFAKG